MADASFSGFRPPADSKGLPLCFGGAQKINLVDLKKFDKNFEDLLKIRSPRENPRSAPGLIYGFEGVFVQIFEKKVMK